MDDIHIVIKINNINRGLLFLKEELLIDINREYTVLDKFYKAKSKHRNIFYAKLENNEYSKKFINKLYGIPKIFSYNILDLSNENIQTYINEEIWDFVETNRKEDFFEYYGFMIDLEVNTSFTYDKSKTLLNWILEQQSNA